jgi:uncharacterized protein
MPPQASAPGRMELDLSKVPKGATVIEGFPGFGLVATIATGFLIDHMRFEQIGKWHFEEAAPTLAIHGCKVVDPVGFYYNKDANVVLIHAINAPASIEWKAADVVLALCKQIEAKELISLEGIGSSTPAGEPKAYFYSTDPKTAKKLGTLGYDCIGEAIIVGVTAALLQKVPGPMTCIFAETKSNLPDSRAAAKVIQLLDKYLGLKVDYGPLLKQAEEFEKKLKVLLERVGKAKEEKEQKEESYIG